MDQDALGLMTNHCRVQNLVFGCRPCTHQPESLSSRCYSSSYLVFCRSDHYQQHGIDMETAVAMPLASRVSLESLPAEIITSIADHLRSIPHVREEYTPRLASPCECIQVTPLKFAKAQLQAFGFYQDEALALGMACRRLREIVFLERLRRAVSLTLCNAAGQATGHMPKRLMNHVRYVWQCL